MLSGIPGRSAVRHPIVLVSLLISIRLVRHDDTRRKSQHTYPKLGDEKVLIKLSAER
jgi:hypothetical protein